MNIALLTTETVHHAWYLKKIADKYPNVLCISEKKQLDIPSQISFFDQRRDGFEAEYFFPKKHYSLQDICKTIETETINSPEVLTSLESADVDVIVTFGTRKIKGALVTSFKNRLLNLHGGDPEIYRGLDSHLWAAYYNDWNAMTTTLHILNEKLDDGAIVSKVKLDLTRISHLYELRAINTEACVELTLSAMEQFKLHGKFTQLKQERKGRYLSAMPEELKIQCEENFRRYKQNV